MASKKINGITIAIDADTSGVTAGLKDLTTKSISLSKQLKTVDSLLKLDPKNTELLATKQKLLAESVETSRKKLQALKGAQEDVKKAVKSGSIGTDEYIAFQKEVVQTEKRLKDLEGQTDDTGDEMKQLGDDTNIAENKMQDLGNTTQTAGNKIEKTEKKSHNLAGALKNGVAAAAEAAATALAAVTTAAGATVAAVVKATGDLSEYGDEIDDNSTKMGISAQAYQEWSYIMQRSGSDISKLQTPIVKLSKALENAKKVSEGAAIADEELEAQLTSGEITLEDYNKAYDELYENAYKNIEAFDKLGYSLDDLDKIGSTEELIASVIGRLQEMDEGTERTALATTLLGKSATELNGVFNMSAEETEDMRKQLHEMGGVLSDEAIKSASDYQDSLLDMKTAIGGVKNNLVADFMPSMIQMMQSVTDLASGNADALEGLEKGAKNFAAVFGKLAKKVSKAVEKMLPVIGKALKKAVPKLLKWAGNTVKQFAQYIYDNRGTIIKAAADLLKWLATGLGNALPKLIPAAVKIIAGLAETLLDNLPTLIDGAINLIRGLADGLIDALPILLEKLPVLWGKFADAMAEAIPKVLELAGDILEKLWKFISDPETWKKIWEALKSIVETLKDKFRDLKTWLLDSLGRLLEKIFEKLGLSKFYERGKAIIQNLWDGMKAIWDKMKGWLESVADFIESKLNIKSKLFGSSKITKVVEEATRGHYARGGVFNTPTRAMLGENGAEAVVPLEHNTGWIDKLAARINRTGGGYSAQITVNVYGDNMNNIGDKIAAKIDTALRRYQVQQTRGQGGTAWAT